MKTYLHAALVFIAIGAILALIVLSTLPADAHGTCKLHRNRNGNVTVVSGPCYYHDFPAGCQVPATIRQGQTVPCQKG